MDEAQLAALLKKAQVSNGGRGITGCLIYQDGYFMQMLEGRRDTVLELLVSIERDPRHRGLRIVMQGEESHRVFLEWSMGFRDMAELPGERDFAQWSRRTINFMELSEDARTCYGYITALAGSRQVKLP